MMDFLCGPKIGPLQRANHRSLRPNPALVQSSDETHLRASRTIYSAPHRYIALTPTLPHLVSSFPRLRREVPQPLPRPVSYLLSARGMDAMNEAFALAALLDPELAAPVHPVLDLAAVFANDLFAHPAPVVADADAPGLADPAPVVADADALGLADPAPVHADFDALLDDPKNPWILVARRNVGRIRGQGAGPREVVSTAAEKVCSLEVPWVDKVGSILAKRNWSMDRKSGLTSTPEGGAFFVYGSYGPSGLEF